MPKWPRVLLDPLRRRLLSNINVKYHLLKDLKSVAGALWNPLAEAGHNDTTSRSEEPWEDIVKSTSCEEISQGKQIPDALIDSFAPAEMPIMVRTDTDDSDKSSSILVALQELAEKREVVITLRVTNRGKRKELRYRRDAILALDLDIVKLINSLEASMQLKNVAPLLELLDKSRSAREDLDQITVQYDQLEEKLNRLEWELKEKEDKLYHHQHSGLIDEAGFKTLKDSSAGLGIESSQKSSSSEVITSYYDLIHDQLLSRKGDADMKLLLIQEFEAEAASRGRTEALKRSFDHEVNQDAQAALVAFDAQYQSLREDLVRTEEDIAELQDRMTEQDDRLYKNNLFDVDTETMIRLSNQAENLLDGDIAVEELDLLKQGPETNLGDGNEHVYGKKVIVNKWLLQILHKSRWPWSLFREYVKAAPLQDQVMSDRDLVELVPQWWYRDGTELIASTPATSHVSSISTPHLSASIIARSHRHGSQDDTEKARAVPSPGSDFDKA